jgi:hypothetical protein
VILYAVGNGDLGSPCQCHDDEFNPSRKMQQHQLRLQPKHPITKPPQTLIPPRIGPAPPRVMRSIHLNHQPAASADEVTDVACHRHLTTKRHSQRAVRERSPEQLLRRRRCCAHFGSASDEQSLTLTETVRVRK